MTRKGFWKTLFGVGLGTAVAKAPVNAEETKKKFPCICRYEIKGPSYDAQWDWSRNKPKFAFNKDMLRYCASGSAIAMSEEDCTQIWDNIVAFAERHRRWYRENGYPDAVVSAHLAYTHNEKEVRRILSKSPYLRGGPS